MIFVIGEPGCASRGSIWLRIKGAAPFHKSTRIRTMTQAKPAGCPLAVARQRGAFLGALRDFAGDGSPRSNDFIYCSGAYFTPVTRPTTANAPITTAKIRWAIMELAICESRPIPTTGTELPA